MSKYPDYPDLTNLETCVKRITEGIQGKLIIDIDKDFDPSKNEIPIYKGASKWRSFAASLEKYVVVKEDGFSEDVQFVGKTTVNGTGNVFVADETDRTSAEGIPESVGLRVCYINDLDTREYSADIWCRAYDRFFSILDDLLKAFGKDVQKVMAGSTAVIPFGQNTADAASRTLDKIINKIIAGHEVGYERNVLKVEPKRYWNCQTKTGADWIGYRLILYSKEKKNDKGEIKHTEAYLTLWKYVLSRDSQILSMYMKGSGEQYAMARKKSGQALG